MDYNLSTSLIKNSTQKHDLNGTTTDIVRNSKSQTQHKSNDFNECLHETIPNDQTNMGEVQESIKKSNLELHSREDSILADLDLDEQELNDLSCERMMCFNDEEITDLDSETLDHLPLVSVYGHVYNADSLKEPFEIPEMEQSETRDLNVMPMIHPNFMDNSGNICRIPVGFESSNSRTPAAFNEAKVLNSFSEFDPLSKQNSNSPKLDWMMTFESPSNNVSSKTHSNVAKTQLKTPKYTIAAESLLDIPEQMLTPRSQLKFTKKDLEAVEARMVANFNNEFQLALGEVQEARETNTVLLKENRGMRETLVQWEKAVKIMISTI